MRVWNPLRRPAFTLIAVLIVVVVLSLAAYRFTDSMTADYRVSVRASEAAQVKTFAVSGVHYAAGMLSDPETLYTVLGNNPYDNPMFGNYPISGTNSIRPGQFSLLAIGDTNLGSGEGRYVQRYGVIDEQSKLNINALIQLDDNGDVLHDALMLLPNMTEEIADAITDWVDADDEPREMGAEASYYAGLPNPYLTKNGPLNSLEELLLVAGVTPDLLFGNDRNRNGMLDSTEIATGDFNRGWSEYLTIYGRELDADSSGNARISLRGSDIVAMADDLAVVLGQEMADYIVAARMYGTKQITTNPTNTMSFMLGPGTSNGSTPGFTIQLNVQVMDVQRRGSSSGNSKSGSSGSGGTVQGGADQLRAAVQKSLSASNPKAKNSVKSVYSLINTQVTLPQVGGSSNASAQVVVPSPLNDPTKLAELLPLLLDTTTPRNGFEMTPRVNVNTAPREVLLAIPNMTEEYADTILSVRETIDPASLEATTGAWLITQAGLPPDTVRKMERYLGGSTMTYRVHSVGSFTGGTGATARVEAVIDTNQGMPRIVYYRDVSDLGPGFSPQPY